MKYLGSLVVVLLACCVALSVGYTTSGNKVYDPNGNAILIRGVARPSLEWNPVGENLALSDYQLMKNWGANTVRLSLNQCYYVSGMSGYTSAYATTIDQQVTWIKSLGMGVILDLHWSNQGNSANGCGQQVMPDSVSTTFWTGIATKYKNDAWVMFELYNEPHDVAWSIWRNGGATGAGWNAVGFQSLYNTVRATGANNVVIIGGLNYAYDLSGVPANAITGTNIAYATHPYDYSGKQVTDWPTGIGAALAYPIIATEFGGFDCGSTYVTNFINYANTNNIGWTAWAWYVNGCSFPSCISDWNGTPTSGSGQAIKTALTSGPKVPSSGSAAATTTTKASTTTTTAKTSTTTGSASTTGGTSANTLTVYTDSVLTPFQDWSWAATKNAADSSKFQSGSKSYSFVPISYQAIYFYNPGAISTTKHKSVNLYVYSTVANPNANFDMIKYSGSSSTITGPDNALKTYATGTNIAANTWTLISCTLSSFASYSTTYDGFWIQDKSGSTTAYTIYVDTITVVGL